MGRSWAGPGSPEPRTASCTALSFATNETRARNIHHSPDPDIFIALIVACTSYGAQRGDKQAAFRRLCSRTQKLATQSAAHSGELRKRGER